MSTARDARSASRVRDDGLDAERAAGAQDAQRDLAAIGDEDALEHQSTPRSGPAPSRGAARVAASAARAGAAAPSTRCRDEHERLAVLDRLAGRRERADDDAVGRRRHVMVDAEHLDVAEQVAAADGAPDLGGGQRA